LVAGVRCEAQRRNRGRETDKVGVRFATRGRVMVPAIAGPAGIR
jgi:hypothetical protein